MIDYNNISIVNCIENKSPHNFEDECISYIKSFIKNDCLNNNHYIIQPTNNDISSKTIEYLKNNNNIKFKKILLENIQKDKTVNYTNVPVVLNYIKDNITTDYILYSDLDVIILKNISNVFHKTDKCLLSILDTTDIIINDLGTDITFNEVYKKYFKPNLNYGIENLNKSINTWFIFANKSHIFFKLYKELTFELLKIIEHRPDLELICEEIAASLIYEMYPNSFLDINEVYNVGFQEINLQQVSRYKCDNNSLLYHYNKKDQIMNNVDTSFKSKLRIKLLGVFNPDEVIRITR